VPVEGVGTAGDHGIVARVHEHAAIPRGRQPDAVVAPLVEQLPDATVLQQRRRASRSRVVAMSVMVTKM
jgi:hypothetical protein